ncbi:hypothetical protein [Fusobacterium gonidiaformans]|uniref:hypothetical protein n=1 Tax=Fusobacterium gonidiaformans TaxID=849 RepID=UPI0023EFECEB|nr:hypothetical protein [Fusobacterium gonidiaformans]
MRSKNFCKKLYSEIDLFLREKKLNRYEVAEKMGVSKQNVSDNLLKLKDGKPVNLGWILKLEETLDIIFLFLKSEKNGNCK